MKKMYPIQVISGKYEGRLGYTFDKTPNKWGNVMFYSYEGKYPYRVCLESKNVKYLD